MWQILALVIRFFHHMSGIQGKHTGDEVTIKKKVTRMDKVGI